MMDKEVSIIIPRGWGDGEESSSDHILRLLTKDEEDLELIDSVNQVRIAARDSMKMLGINIIDVETAVMSNPNHPSEYVVISQPLNKKEELDILRSSAPELKIPKVFRFDEYDTQPFFPVVFKSESHDGGQLKYLIETPKQWAKFKRFLLHGTLIGNLSPKDRDHFRDIYDLDTLEPESEGYKTAKKSYNQAIKKHLNPIHDQPLGKDYFTIQEFIECPSDRYTSYRLLVSATGDIKAAALIYSGDKKSDKKIISADSDIEDGYIKFKEALVEDPKSRTYIASRDIRSNHSQGGGLIVLDPFQTSKAATQMEEGILAEHGIDPKHPKIPKLLAQQASKIAKSLGKRCGLYVGIDFIQDDQGNFYYLETNSGPGLETYKSKYPALKDFRSAYSDILSDSILDTLRYQRESD